MPGCCPRSVPATSFRRRFGGVGRIARAGGAAFCDPWFIKSFSQDCRMFDYSRPHPHVHVLRLRGHRTLRRLFTGSLLILFGIGYLRKNQVLIPSNELWLFAPAAIALSFLARPVARPGAVSVVRAV